MLRTVIVSAIASMFALNAPFVFAQNQVVKTDQSIAQSKAAGSVKTAMAIVLHDQVSLRAAPRDSAQQHAQLSAGEVLEVRGERLDYVQVYDHKRERAGFVKASVVKRLRLTAEDAPELLSVLRFVRDTPGSEALGIGYAAAFIKAAPATLLNGPAGIEVFDALGTMADRLAWRASSVNPQNKLLENAVAAHLEVARSYGVGFTSFERDDRVQICYDGDALRRVLALAATNEQKARAALAVTKRDCIDPNLRPNERAKVDAWRNDVLNQIQLANVPDYLKNRVQMRRASVQSVLAFSNARAGQESASLAAASLNELSAIARSDLTDDDQSTYADSAMRVGASRWAASINAAPILKNGLTLQSEPGQPGETCVSLLDAKRTLLIKKCTYGIAWLASAASNASGSAIALAVQPLDAWREMWMLRKTNEGWVADVLPPSATSPAMNSQDVGYVEFAGFTPDGNQVLVAREAKLQGKYKKSFEVLAVDTLNSVKQASDPSLLAAFQKWQDVSWKRATVSLR